MSTPAIWRQEFLVNTTTASFQDGPVITALADGRFVVAWVDYSATGGDTSSIAIRAQLFNANGTISGTEFLVNTTTASTQLQPTITALADGGFVVAWTDGSQTGGDTSLDAVRAQLYNGDGSTFGAEFLVNTTTARYQDTPTITALADGRFVVAWTDTSATGGDTSGGAIRAQLFNADGSTFGAEFLVNTTTTGTQADPRITALADGRFVVAWLDDSMSGGDTSGSAIRAQVFNADGSTFGAEFLVNTTTASYQETPTITALADGRFVVAWTDGSASGGDTSGSAIRAQRFNADGSTFGAEFLVNTTTAYYQLTPSITALADGRFVVAWQDYSQTGGDTSSYAVRAQVFNGNGSTSGAEFLVNTTTANSQDTPTITALADGRFVVAWTDASQTGGDRSGSAIRGQIFDPREAAVDLTGSALGDGFVGTAFADVMHGRAGADRLAGEQGDDALFGQVGNDALFGRGGADTLAGGAGHDVLTGGPGTDTFVFAKGGGHDIVTDFQNGKDVLDLTAFGFGSFAAAAAHFTTTGADVVFSFGPDTLLIEAFTLAQLSAPDLIL